MSSERSAWQRPDGWPSDDYFSAVAAALTAAGIGVESWEREEDWDTTYELDPAAYAAGSLGGATTAYGLYLAWRVDEDEDPAHADDFTGDGWYYVPYSKPGALGDYAGPLWLPYLAEPAEVARAAAELIGAHPVLW